MNRRPQTTEALLNAIRENPRGRYQEWADAVGLKSTSTIGYHLHKLEREGLVRLHPGRARSVEIVEGGELEEWRDLAREAIGTAEEWKEQAMQARRWAATWKAAAKRWRGSIVCPDDRPPLAESV